MLNDVFPQVPWVAASKTSLQVMQELKTPVLQAPLLHEPVPQVPALLRQPPLQRQALSCIPWKTFTGSRDSTWIRFFRPRYRPRHKRTPTSWTRLLGNALSNPAPWTYSMGSPIWSATTFVNSVRTTLIPRGPADPTVHPLQPRFSVGGSVFDGTSINVVSRAKKWLLYPGRSSKPFSKRISEIFEYSWIQPGTELSETFKPTRGSAGLGVPPRTPY